MKAGEQRKDAKLGAKCRLTRISRIGHQGRHRDSSHDPESQCVVLPRPFLVLAELLLVLERKAWQRLARTGRMVLELDDFGYLPDFHEDTPERVPVMQSQRRREFERTGCPWPDSHPICQQDHL